MSSDNLPAGEHPCITDGDLGADRYAKGCQRGDAKEREIAPSCQDVVQSPRAPFSIRRTRTKMVFEPDAFMKTSHRVIVSNSYAQMRAILGTSSIPVACDSEAASKLDSVHRLGLGGRQAKRATPNADSGRLQGALGTQWAAHRVRRGSLTPVAVLCQIP